MKILFITAGLSSLRGRANSYQEALMEALAARGHSVNCLLTALVDAQWRPHTETEAAPWDPKARLHKIFNAGVYPGLYPQGGVGTRNPRRDVMPTPWLRETVLEIVRREQPDVISYQSIFGLPFDLIREINGLGIRTVFTMHDYFVLCPTAHLFRPDHTRCRRMAPELDCANCCRESLGYGFFRLSTNLDRLAERTEPGSWQRQSAYRARNLVKKAGLLANNLTSDEEGYRLRREAACRMLQSFTVLHCISEVQREVVRELAGDLANIEVLPLIPPSITTVAPLRRGHRSSGNPVRFVALNINGPYKGAGLLAEAFGELEREGIDYLLEIHGPPPENLFKSPRVTIHERYALADLDGIASQADYCLLPSICDETLGFVGMEMLARGVPLIASSFTGASRFVRHEGDGFVFDPREKHSLVKVLRKICASDEKAALPSGGVGVAEGLKPYPQHVAEMEKLFES